MSHVSCHQCQSPQSPIIPWIPPPLCTVGWFARTEIIVFGNQPTYQKQKKITSNTQKSSNSKQNRKKKKKSVLCWPFLATNSLNRSLQSMWFQVQWHQHTNKKRLTFWLIYSIGLGADTVKRECSSDVCVPLRKTQFPLNWRLLGEEHIANIGIPLECFGFFPVPFNLNICKQLKISSFSDTVYVYFIFIIVN